MSYGPFTRPQKEWTKVDYSVSPEVAEARDRLIEQATALLGISGYSPISVEHSGFTSWLRYGADVVAVVYFGPHPGVRFLVRPLQHPA